ncbi:hypothetical protein ACQUW5_10470 [Legionella sp. CNM-1927-20]|uniref:hypothetical protein n=1 Tax=Legionella sp. CNM-1927-20 TaxID=3422221 RepID=UPI00403AB40F
MNNSKSFDDPTNDRLEDTELEKISGGVVARPVRPIDPGPPVGRRPDTPAPDVPPGLIRRRPERG